MSSYVVDASVAVKWILPEIYSDNAKCIFKKCKTLLAPDLIYSEVASVLWKRSRKKEITKEEALISLQVFGEIPFKIITSWPISLLALEIAQRSDRSIYDSLYLAVAMQQKTKMITADKRLYNSLSNSPISKHLLWIESF